MKRTTQVILSLLLVLTMAGGLAPSRVQALERTVKFAAAPADTVVKAVVVMKEPSVIAQGIDPASAQGFEAAQQLKDKQLSVSTNVAQLVNEYRTESSSAEVRSLRGLAERRFAYTLNGFSVTVPYGLLEKISRLEGVDHVFIEQEYAAPEVEEAEVTAIGSGNQPEAYEESIARTLVGADVVNAAGYNGEGMTVGILDTGLRTTHVMFQNAPANPVYTSKISISGLNGADNKFVSTRVPFAFDYSGWDNEVGFGHYHGTHVAGIIGGYVSDGSTYNGIATQAQLLIFKVFDDAGGGCYDSVLLSALEDVALIKPDVINMSLGSPCGSTYDLPGNDDMAKAYQAVYDNGTMCSFSAGNDFYSGYGSGVDAGSPNYGIVGSPSTYPAALSVAACNNANIRSTTMDGYSSWGSTDDLAIKPEITAPGGNVVSAYNSSDSALARLSGTSMAAPQVAGCMALLKQQLNATGSYALSEEQALINQLFMSTSYMMQRGGNYYSPRKMGAGLIKVDYAVNTPVYLTVDGTAGNRPKIELGMTGNGTYTLSFMLHNRGTEAKTYNVSTVAMTDTVSAGKIVINNTPTPHMLSATVEGAEPVRVEAGASRAVTLTLELSEEDIAYYEENYPNGGFVEGFVILDDSDGLAPALSLPFLGFYGNADDAPILDETILNAQHTHNSPVGVFTNYNVENDPYGYVATEEEPPLLGMNPMDRTNYSYKTNVYPDNITTSSTGDTNSVNKGILYLSLSMMRNVDYVEMKIEDANTGAVYYHVAGDMQMPRYSTSAGPIWADVGWEGTDRNGNPLADGTRLIFTVIVKAGTGKTESASFPITIDNNAPKILTEGDFAPFITDDGVKQILHVAVEDRALAKLVLKADNGSSTKTIAENYYYEYNHGVWWQEFDVTGYTGGRYEFEMEDYARFQTIQTLFFDGEGAVNAMYRLYNPNSGEHFYTANEEERDWLDGLGWNYEGIAWYAPTESNTPVFRLYNKNAGDHHYTPSVEERDWLVGLGWNYEGIGWYSDDNEEVPLYRLYNPNAKAGSHHYTTSEEERDWLAGLGWNYEGIGWYGVRVEEKE